MKKIAFLSLLSITCLISYGQIGEKEDSLVNEICKTIKLTKNLSDSEKILFVYNKYMVPFLSSYPEEQRESIFDAIGIRLQRSCMEVQDILNRKASPKGNWQIVADRPKALLDIKICKHFLDHKRYYYLESTGDTVNLTIENGFWIDRFKDDTYSKLKFNWINEYEFEIEFIESDNATRKNFSKRGDKYKYQILDKKLNCYLMSVEIVGINRFMIFKLYY